MKDSEKMMRDISMEVEITRRSIGKDSLDQRVLTAMKTVARHEFVPDEMKTFAYDNNALSIGHGQTISQPFIVALMTELLNPRPEDLVLEIGTGSGYQAAILSLLVKYVYSIEIVDKLGTQASDRLRDLGYRNIQVRTDDGYRGWPEHAPYDGIIIVTAAVPSIPQPLVDQLKPGGSLVIPIGLPYLHQELMVVEKHEHGKIETREILSVAFVPLTRKSS